MGEEYPAEFLQLILLGKARGSESRVWRVLVLQAIEGACLALRHKEVKGLPVPEAEHGAVLVDQLAKKSARVRSIRFVDSGLAISSDVELRGPSRSQGHNSKKLPGEHRGVDQSFERNRREIHAATDLAGHSQRTTLVPVGRHENRRLDHQLALVDAARVKHDRIPRLQELMIGDGIFQQRVKVDANTIGLRRDVNVNRVDVLGIACPGQSRVPGTYPEHRKLLNWTGRPVLTWNPTRIRQCQVARPHPNFFVDKSDSSRSLRF